MGINKFLAYFKRQNTPRPATNLYAVDFLYRHRLKRHLEDLNDQKPPSSGLGNKIFIAGLILAFTFLPFRTVFAAAYLTLNSFSGNPTTIQVSGGGWASGETVSIYLGSSGGTPVATATVGADSFWGPAAVTIPANTPQGPLSIIGVGSSSGETQSNSYYVVAFSPSVNPSPSPNSPGSSNLVSGSGYAPGEIVDFSIGGSAAGSTTADSGGAFVDSSMTVPFVSPGTYQLQATGASSLAQATNYFYVGGFYPSAYPSSYYLLPGQSLNFTGSGWAAGETITVTESSAGTLTTFNADSSGGFTSAGDTIIPFSFLNSSRTFHLAGALSGGSADVSVTIGQFYPGIYPSAYYISPNQPLSFSGNGFAGNETIKVYEGTRTAVLSSFSADADGNFSNEGSLTVPSTFAGSPRLFRLVGDASGAEGEVVVTIGQFYPNIMPSSYFMRPGQTLGIDGSGFAPGEIIDLSLAGGGTAQVTADSTGGFSGANLTVPFTSMSMLTLTALGESSHATANVIITLGKYFPGVLPSNYFAFAGDNLTFILSDFAPGENITVSSASTTLVVLTADSLGQATTSPITIPFGSASPINYVFTGQSSQASTNVSITLGVLYPYGDTDSYYATPGSIVQVRGFNFGHNEPITISGGTTVVHTTANASGNTGFVPLTLPFGVASPVTITIEGNTTGASVSLPITLAPFSPQISPDTWYTAPGNTVNFTGSGFANGENVHVTLNGSGAGDVTATATGTINSFNVNIPFSVAGTAHIVFTGDTSGASASVDIGLATLSPSIWLSNYYDVGGSPLTVFGGGFGGGETVHVSFGGSSLGSIAADNSGSFSLVSTVPYGMSGNKVVMAHGSGSGLNATASFTQPQVYINVQLGSYAGAPGDAINFIGSGFLANEPVEITTDRTGSTVVHSFSADASGNFNNSDFVTPAPGGPLTLTIRGTHSFTTTEITYYVTGP